MNLGRNRGAFDCRSLLGGLMGGDAAARRAKTLHIGSCVLFDSLDDVDRTSQRRLRKSLRSTLNPKTGNRLARHAGPDELFWSPELISIQHCIS